VELYPGLPLTKDEPTTAVFLFTCASVEYLRLRTSRSGEGWLTPEAFAEHLMGWISPLCIVRATQRLEEDPNGAVSTSEIHLRSLVLESAEEAGLLPMMTGFLSHFRFSPELISLVEILTSRRFSPLCKEFLLNLRFEGSIFGTSSRSAIEGNELLVVIERDIVADLLLTPVRMLTHFVTGYAKHWKRAKADGLRVFLLHSADGVFPVEVETRVARAYGYDSAGGFSDYDLAAQRVNYRSLTLLYNGAFVRTSRDLVEICRNAATKLAASTLTPLPGRRSPKRSRKR